jgi:hypothetical protein
MRILLIIAAILGLIGTLWHRGLAHGCFHCFDVHVIIAVEPKEIT